MKLDESVNFFGTAYKMCQALGVQPQAYTAWKKKGHLPMVHQYKVEILSNGALKADGSNVSNNTVYVCKVSNESGHFDVAFVTLDKTIADDFKSAIGEQFTEYKGKNRHVQECLALTSLPKSN
jgi:hypothetical protein